MAAIDEIMGHADRYASESIVYSNHQNVKLMVMRDAARNDLMCTVRCAMEAKDEEIAGLQASRDRHAAALADAERKGAEAMRSRIFAELGVHYGNATEMHLAVARELDKTRALPLPTGSQS